MSDPEPLEPGRVEEIRVQIGGTANLFEAGHRIRLDVSSSNFPRFDANTNTGGTIADEGHDAAVPALNRVFHDGSRPSRLLLPVRSAGAASLQASARPARLAGERRNPGAASLHASNPRG
jgi:predicted acyl esterase